MIYIKIVVRDSFMQLFARHLISKFNNMVTVLMWFNLQEINSECADIVTYWSKQ